MTESIILRRKQMLEHWGLSESPPFFVVPPKDDPRMLSRLFTGRRQEMDRIILPLLDGHNVLLRGMWGIGKSTFILQTLNELSDQATQAGDKLLPIYIDNFKGGTPDEFYRLLLFTLVTNLSKKDKDAKKLADAMKGISVSQSRTKGVKGNFEVSLFSVGSLGGALDLGASTESQYSLANPSYWVQEFLNRAGKHYTQVIIAIDDLDKTDPNLEDIIKMRNLFDNILPILRDNKCAFILTGRGSVN